MASIALRCATLMLALLLVSCGSDSRAPKRLVIIGLDGAEWSLIHPLVEAGEMPNLGRLMDRGVHGKLRSLEPLAKSPAIWTTIATGKSPDEHGIHTFVDKRGGQPLTANMRRVRAIWNIAGGVDRTVGVVGWLMSWPAEAVNGFVVSDYLQYAAKPSTRVEGRTYPPELAAEIEGLVVRWPDVPWSQVQPFLDAPLDTARMAPALEAILRPIKWIMAGDETFTRVATRLYRERKPDVLAVYLRGMDAMGHLYWNYMTPEAIPAGTLRDEAMPYLPGAMRAYYRYTDKLVGRLLDEIDSDTAILVVSDHGYKGGPGRGVDAHNVDGVLIMDGPGIGSGEIEGATVYDVLPTALVLLGLPPARDMRGKVLWAGLDHSIPRDAFSELIATYETGKRDASGAPIESAVDEELKERLRSLGYID